MTTALVTTNEHEALQVDNKSLLALVTEGDCGKLDDAQKLAYYKARCDAAGLDYRAQPFQFVKLNGKTVLYALKACSEQLAAKHGLSVRLVETPRDVQELAASGGCRAFTARVTGKDGRETDNVGVVTVSSLKADALGNAIMKGVTKAERRAVLAHCGLGMLDETEIETIPRAQPVRVTIKDNDGEATTDEALEKNLQASVNQSPAAGATPAPAGTSREPAPARSPAAPASNGKSPGTLAHDLILSIQQIDNEHHHKNWWTKHEAEWGSLPPPLRKAVQTAYDNWAPGK